MLRKRRFVQNEGGTGGRSKCSKGMGRGNILMAVLRGGMAATSSRTDEVRILVKSPIKNLISSTNAVASEELTMRLSKAVRNIRWLSDGVTWKKMQELVGMCSGPSSNETWPSCSGSSGRFWKTMLTCKAPRTLRGSRIWLSLLVGRCSFPLGLLIVFEHAFSRWSTSLLRSMRKSATITSRVGPEIASKSSSWWKNLLDVTVKGPK